MSESLLPEPPFYRGEKGYWHADICDHLAEGDDNACDQESAYLIEWHNRPELDRDPIPVSGACERHALEVDRRQVARICTHPDAGTGATLAALWASA